MTVKLDRRALDNLIIRKDDKNGFAIRIYERLRLMVRIRFIFLLEIRSIRKIFGVS